MGKAAFVHLSDGRERLQIYVRRDETKGISSEGREVQGWELFQLLDHGDIIGVAGYLFVTKTGELSVHVRELQFLAKALLPMPDKMHGISDPEIRRRQRYIDLLAGSLKVKTEKSDESGAGQEDAENELTPRQVFERRSKIIGEMRRFLDEHGYLEVETPMLTPLATGAAAKPFKTHHNALGIDLYARIAPELYLKRLLVGGFERVYELNRNFRNEGIGYRWNPEFTMLEFYCAYMDVNGMMDFCEELLRTTVQKATGGAHVRYGENEIDFASPFERLTMKQAIIKYYHESQELIELSGGLDERQLDQLGYVYALAAFTDRIAYLTNHFDVTHKTPEEQKVDCLEERQRFVGETVNLEKLPEETKISLIARSLEKIFAYVAEPNLKQPTFITDFPKAISPLSKASPDDPAIAERFELFIAGMEVANGFSELNDPVEQYERFAEQARRREGGDEEAMQMDEDYLRALAYGMPPAAGIGIGIDRFVMILTNRFSIRDVILFPHMRPHARKTEEEM